MRLEHISGPTGNCSRGGDVTRSEHGRGKPALVLRRDGAGALLSECLTQVLRRQSDFFAELDQLFFGELLTRFGVRGRAL